MLGVHKGENGALEVMWRVRRPRLTHNALLRAVLMGFLLTLPIERVAVLDFGGFNLRPSYLFMALFVLLRLQTKVYRSLLLAVLAGLAVVLLAFGEVENWRVWLGNIAWALLNAVFFVFLISYLKDKARLERLLELYVGTAALWAGVIVAQWLGSFAFPGLAYGFVGAFPRVHGLMYEPSYVPIYLLPPLLLAFYRRRTPQAALIFLACLFCFSRTAWLMLGLTVLLLALFGRNKRVALIGLVAAVPFLGALFLAPADEDHAASPLGFVTSAFTLSDQASTVPRLESWTRGMELFETSPWVGVGLGNYGYAFVEHYGYLGRGDPKTIKTTNLFTEILAETGLLGFALFALWVAFPLLLLNKRSSYNRSLLIGWVVLLASYALIQTWWRPYLWTFAAVVYASALNNRRPPALRSTRPRPRADAPLSEDGLPTPFPPHPK